MIFILFNFTSPIPLKYAFAYQVPSINLRSVSPPDVYTGIPSLCVVSAPRVSNVKSCNISEAFNKTAFSAHLKGGVADFEVGLRF